MDKTKPELYGRIQELKYEVELLKKQLILTQKNNEQRNKH
jgi:hypothetical protein